MKFAGKRILTGLLAAVMMAGLAAGCDSADPFSSPESVGSALSAQQENAETAEYVKSAMEAGNQLSSSTYFLADDGSVLTCQEKSWDGLAADSAAVEDKKKLAVSASGMTVFTLTKDGGLYYRQQKVADGVQDIAYATTNVNESGMFISGDKVFNIDCRDTGKINAALRESNPENYIDTGSGKTVARTAWNVNFQNLSSEQGAPVSGTLSGVAVDKHDFFLLNQAGQAFVCSGGGTDYMGMDCFQWEKMAMIGVANDMEEPALTVAGIQYDGTVMACGDYADEILSWGSLACLSMSDGMIVGLTKDGDLRMTGRYAEFMAPEVESWKNIAAVKVGSTAKIEAIVNAVDIDGKFYHLEYDRRWTELVSGVLDPEAGQAEKGAVWYKYAPDGTAYRVRDTGKWEPAKD